MKNELAEWEKIFENHIYLIRDLKLNKTNSLVFFKWAKDLNSHYYCYYSFFIYIFVLRFVHCFSRHDAVARLIDQIIV